MTHATDVTPERATVEPFTTEYLHTLLAHMRLWVLELALWFADVCGDSPIGDAIRAGLRDDLRLCRRCLAATFALLAMRRCPPPPQTRRFWRPPNAPRGVRRPHNLYGSCRAITRRLPCGRGLRAQCEALRAAMDNVEAMVARMVALLETTPIAAYIMTRAPRDPYAALFIAQPDVADSS